MYLSFYFAFIPMLFLYTDIHLIYLVAGGSLIFGAGVIPKRDIIG